MNEDRPPSVKRLEQTTSGWGLGPSPLPELLPVAYFHDSDRETEADQCLTIYMGIGGFHGDVYLLHKGIWECGRTGVIWKAGRCRPRSL